MKCFADLAHLLSFEHRRLAWHVVRLAARDFLKDNGPTWAAAIAYYSLLSIFPLLLAVGSIASLFIDPQWAVHEAIVRLGNFLPREPALIEKTVRNALDAGRGSGLLSILPLLWTGSRPGREVGIDLRARGSTVVLDHYPSRSGFRRGSRLARWSPASRGIGWMACRQWDR